MEQEQHSTRKRSNAFIHEDELFMHERENDERDSTSTTEEDEIGATEDTTNKCVQRGQRGRSFVFTLWDPETNEGKEIKKRIKTYEKFSYVFIGGIEKCPSTNRLHQHGFCYTKSQIRVSTLINSIGKVYWNLKKGTIAQNITYATKENPMEFEQGARPIDEPTGMILYILSNLVDMDWDFGENVVLIGMLHYICDQYGKWALLLVILNYILDEEEELNTKLSTLIVGESQQELAPINVLTAWGKFYNDMGIREDIRLLEEFCPELPTFPIRITMLENVVLYGKFLQEIHKEFKENPWGPNQL